MSAVRKRSQLNKQKAAEMPANAVAPEHWPQRIADLEAELEEKRKHIASLEETVEWLENKIRDLVEGSNSGLSAAVADQIVEKLADKTADGVVKHIIGKLLKTLELVPAAKDIAVRFKTRDALWVDEESTRTHVLETWRKHMKETLKVSIEELDDVYTVSLVVPEVRVSAKQPKTHGKQKILIDADREA